VVRATGLAVWAWVVSCEGIHNLGLAYAKGTQSGVDITLPGATVEMPLDVRSPSTPAIKVQVAWAVRVLDMVQPDVQPPDSGKDLPRDADMQPASVKRAQEAAAIIEASAPRRAGGAVAYAKMRLRWNAAKASHATAAANLVRVVSALLDGEEFADEPRLDEARAAAAMAGGRLPPFGELEGAIDDALDVLASVAGDERSAMQTKAVQAIDRYRAKLEEDPMLRELQYTYLGTYAIVDEVDAALLSLRAALAE
jgi:hypothetical protein